MSNGFIKDLVLKGAVATSISHDSHNIITIGTNSIDMAKAVNELIQNQGGLTVSYNNTQKV